MANAATTPAWIALFLGLYLLAASVAELRNPGSWLRIADSVEAAPALGFLAGAFTFALGAAIYLVTPWNPGDWLGILVSVIGGLAVAKGLLLIAAPERVHGLGKRLLARKSALVAGSVAVLGAALLFVALSRLQFT